MIGYYFRCLRFLWKNREWKNTRQKFKAMDKFALNETKGLRGEYYE